MSGRLTLNVLALVVKVFHDFQPDASLRLLNFVVCGRILLEMNVIDPIDNFDLV